MRSKTAIAKIRPPFRKELMIPRRKGEDNCLWCSRATQKPHAGLCWSTACLAVIADDAGCYDIFPGMSTAKMTGDDMING